jgi:hypothetical protein
MVHTSLPHRSVSHISEPLGQVFIDVAHFWGAATIFCGITDAPVINSPPLNNNCVNFFAKSLRLIFEDIDSKTSWLEVNLWFIFSTLFENLSKILKHIAIMSIK